MITNFTLFLTTLIQLVKVFTEYLYKNDLVGQYVYV